MTGFALAGSALVLLDCQSGVAANAFGENTGARARFCAAVRSAVAAARAAGMPCVRVEVEFRPGHPEIAATNSYFTTVRDAGRLVAGSEQAAPMAELADLLTEFPRVVKRRIGALSNTDLPVLLAGLGCDGLVLAGLVTRGAVLSTSCLAADLDYRVAVLSDAIHDPDPVVHDILLRSVLPLRAAVLTGADLRVAR